ncbi:hypothetical protein [Spongiimicrobium sp. 3-5]|uniref:hypothetical protein n=1 Tax=Spongiimicrobium sp. 3-5 TaxID=3332596 RepID=UPI003980095C
MINKTTILAIGFFGICSCSKQSKNDYGLQTFITQIATSEMAIEQIRKETLVLVNRGNVGAQRIKARDSLIEAQLLELRTMLNSCDTVSYLTVNEARKLATQKELHLMPMAIENKQSAYYITCNNEIILPVLLEDGKVVSTITITLTKRPRRYFVRF